MVAKPRMFSWIPQAVLPADPLTVFARADDYFFGVLHSKTHALWARGTGTQIRVAQSGLRYTPATSFETYPLPWAPGHEPTDHPRVVAIAEAARRLVDLRDRWLNPPEIAAAELNKRTLTNLHNARPTWLANAHKALDRAVCDAYGWPHDLTDDALLARLFALNAERAAGSTP